MTSQNTTVLTVEFTGTPLNRCAKIHRRTLLDAEPVFPASCQGAYRDQLSFYELVERRDEANGSAGQNDCAESTPKLHFTRFRVQARLKKQFFDQ
jgi:hypothetical protein